MLIVLAGKHGSGFSIQSEGGPLTSHLPALLRLTANEIEQSLGTS